MAVSLYSWSCAANIYSGGTLAYIASKSGQNLIADGQQHSGYVTMPAYSAIPARSGYTLKGYSMSPGATTPSLFPGDDLWWSEAGNWSHSFTVYCVWEADSFTVSFNATGGSGAPEDQSKSTGVDLTLSSTVPTWTGHTFSEWNTSPDGTGASYSPGGTYATDADVVLYAIWATDTYTVSYNANGGSGAPASQTKTYGEDLVLSDMLPTYSGKTFVEWNTAADGTGTSYTPGGTYTANAGATLYAIWTATVYTVTYDANGHGTAPAAQTKSPGGNVTVASAISATGCSFVAWNTKPDASGTRYDPGDTYSADADVTLYAIWVVGVFVVTFDADGGTVSPAQKLVGYSLKYGPLPTPTKAGGTFYGWFLGDLLITENSIVDLDDDATLKAAWSVRSSMRVKGSDDQLHTGALYVKGSDGQMHMAIAYVKGSDGQMHING